MIGSNGKWNNPVSRVGGSTGQALQSLSSYLGGWNDFLLGGDVIAFTLAGYVKGNATSSAEYKLQGDICYYRGQYFHGTTTAFPGGGALVLLNLPVAARIDMGGSDCFGGRIVDGSAGQGQPVDFTIFTTTPTQALISTMGVQTFCTATVPFTWAASDQIRWNFWYRAQG